MSGFSISRCITMAGMLIMFMFAASLHGQDTKKAMKYMEKAVEYFHQANYKEAEMEVDKAVLADSNLADPYILKGNVCLETGREAEAVELFRKALAHNPERPDLLLNLLANTLFEQESYGEAIPVFERLLHMPDIRDELRNDASLKKETATFRKGLMDKPVAFDPRNLGRGINSAADEYVNALTADGRGLYFTRKELAAKGEMRKYNEDLYFGELSGDTALGSFVMDYPPGKDKDAGALCVSADGRLLIFTACYRNDSYGSCDLYYAVKTGQTWSQVKNLGKNVNSTSWDAQPCLSSDGQTLYFASSRPGGYGGSDIWKTRRLGNGDWAKPENLGPSINTSGGEMAPFIHFDGQTLYFSSSGHRGMGGADLFKSTSENGIWTEPANLGYPINTSSDELIVIVNARGEKGYISRNDRAGEGSYDIFVFEMEESLRPIPVSYLKGSVKDRENGKPLQALFRLIDLDKDSIMLEAESDPLSGEFLVCLPLSRQYALHVSCPGYLFYSEHFPLNEVKAASDPVQKNILMEPVVIGNTMVLRNIFYETGQYELKPTSHAELNKLVEFMRANPGIRIEIGGHTDSVGSEEDNMTLSLNRAAAVYHYLVNSGIAPERITFKGYGETRPLAENESENDRAMNRRTEITVIR